jgi:hypothetical protein
LASRFLTRFGMKVIWVLTKIAILFVTAM